MIPGLRVIAPGPHTTIQDLGRVGYRDIGVPLSGPLDRVALRLANALVGNDANAPCLEFLLQGPEFEVLADSVRVAVIGADGLEIEGRGPIVPGRNVRLVRGDRVRCRASVDLSCGYLGIESGFDVPRVLGSAATYARGSIGGLYGGVLREGDVLAVRADAVAERPERMLPRPFDPELQKPIRVVLGPQDDHFTADAINIFLSARYVISPQADRMGFRLDGPALAHIRGHDIASDGLVPGAVQAPGSGRPIVVLVDGQTTGGYPKIATVISADLPLIGRRHPGAEMFFIAVTQEQAEAARREQEQMLTRYITNIRELASGLDEAALYSANLVGGVSDGLE